MRLLGLLRAAALEILFWGLFWEFWLYGFFAGGARFLLFCGAELSVLFLDWIIGTLDWGFLWNIWCRSQFLRACYLRALIILDLTDRCRRFLWLRIFIFFLLLELLSLSFSFSIISSNLINYLINILVLCVRWESLYLTFSGFLEELFILRLAEHFLVMLEHFVW